MAKSFPALVAKKKGRKAILICTVAASPNITCIPNSVYRFFVNAKHEADQIVDHLPDELMKAAMIHYGTPYGNSVTERFAERWPKSKLGRECSAQIVLKEQEWTKIKRELGQPTNVAKLKGKDTLLVVAYCTAYQDILLALMDNGIDATIVTTSTFSFKKMDEPKKTMLDHFKWISCIPIMRDQPFYGDVANYFAFATLFRLGLVIFEDGYEIGQFHKHWQAVVRPERLEGSIKSGKWEDPDILLTLDMTHASPKSVTVSGIQAN